MKILSIHLGHDASICLYNEGNIEKYFLIERFTGIKHDSNFYGVMRVLFNFILLDKVDILCISTFNVKLNGFDAISEISKICQKYNPNVKIIVKSDHHLNHAYLSFYNSKFDESIVIVVDGCGSFVSKDLVEVESIFKFKNKNYELIYKNVVENFTVDLPWDKKFNNISSKYDHKNIFGIGGLYDIAALLTGNTEDDCGKAMGLSSYGKCNKKFSNIFLEKNTLNNNFYQQSSDEIKYFLKNPIKEIKKDNYKLHADFCYEVQKQTQKAVGDLIEDAIIKTNIKNVCISGGYGMNIVANYYYIQRFPDINFYFEPLCNDSGVSIGAAISTYVELTKKIPTQIKNTFFHGEKYDISNYSGVFKNVEDIANLLFKNKSVAVYRDFAEAGQRALGNRSIFFNAMNPNAKDIVNKIKKREWYRPFACAVIEEDADKYFDMGKIKSNSSMTICFPVRKKYVKIIPGVTHVDNTCRVQTVSKEDGYLYDILCEFKKLSGHGILLNTSFNLAGKPLVETPKDAFDTLNNSSLDYLWFEETKQIFTKKKFTYV